MNQDSAKKDLVYQIVGETEDGAELVICPFTGKIAEIFVTPIDLKSVLATKLSTVELSTETINQLKEGGLLTFGSLVISQRDEVRKLVSGEDQMEEIEELLSKEGFEMGMNVDPSVLD